MCHVPSGEAARILAGTRATCSSVGPAQEIKTTIQWFAEGSRRTLFGRGYVVGGCALRRSDGHGRGRNAPFIYMYIYIEVLCLIAQGDGSHCGGGA